MWRGQQMSDKIVMIAMTGCGACESAKKNISRYEENTNKKSRIEIVDCAVSKDARCQKVEGFPTFFKGNKQCRVGSGTVEDIYSDCQ